MPTDITFVAKIVDRNGGGYKIWLPKQIFLQLPQGIWILPEVNIKSNDYTTQEFKQTLLKHPVSKGGANRHYIPIYTDDVMTDYKALGFVDVTIIY